MKTFTFVVTETVIYEVSGCGETMADAARDAGKRFGDDPCKFASEVTERYAECKEDATDSTLEFDEGVCGLHADSILSSDSGAVTLPYALLVIAGYMVYWMISHGIIQALTALQVGR